MDETNYMRKTIQGNPMLWKFLGVFLVVFFIFAVFLYVIDFVPEAPKQTAQSERSTSSTDALPIVNAVQELPAEDPVRIVAPTVGIDTAVGNPISVSNEVLDNALLKGAVRYPDSALLGENARMYIFGHQSYLPVVHNQAFKAFNGLQKLKVGDEITVYSASALYHYRVSTVKHVTADQGVIELGSGDRTLTLSTCDSFGTKSDRYIVTAQFVSREALIHS